MKNCKMARNDTSYRMPEATKKTTIRQKLLDWFHENRRDLPWRYDRDPYKVWVSEIMLQQTQVDTVIPYYNRFMEKFPTVHALADAADEDVLKAWEGLGYYSRARNLHSAVREVARDYGGVVPNQPEEISRLKGVGPYTAGAILSLAYGKAEPAVDGNVMRVMARLFAIEDDIAKQATRVKMEQLVRQLIPPDAPGAFNEGLMELGALICTPRNPDCLFCPLIAECKGREAGIHEQLPVKKKNKPVRLVSLVCGIVMKEGRVLVRKRPEQGLLAGMWEFPNVEQADLSALLPGMDIKWGPAVGTVSHVFSHVKWKLKVYRGEIHGQQCVLPADYHWVDLAALSEYAFPKVFHKVRQLAHI